MTPFEKSARAYVASRKASGTRYLYGLELDRWLWHCEKQGIDPADATLTDSAAYRDLPAPRGKVNKPQSIRRKLASLSAIYHHAMCDEAAKRNPFDGKILPRPGSEELTPTANLTAEEIEKLIASCKDVREHAVICLLAVTGLRRASVARLRRSDFFVEGEVNMMRVTLKGNRYHEVEITRYARSAVNQLIEVSPPSAYLFPDKSGRSPIDPDIITKIVRRVGVRASIPHAHPHRFRVSYITTALDAGVPAYEVQRAVGHKSLSMTQRYDRGKRGRGVTAAVDTARKERAGK